MQNTTTISKYMERFSLNKKLTTPLSKYKNKYINTPHTEIETESYPRKEKKNYVREERKK